MNILSIGNSYSQDAQRYLHEIAKADGFTLDTFNLYIPGCSLSRHFRNMLTQEQAYMLEMNGVSTGFKVSLDQALLNRNWDVVTVQQASHESADYRYYQPYLSRLVAYIKDRVPNAKIALHQTWAYEQGSDKLKTRMGYADQADMFLALKAAYDRAAADISPDLVIPSGALFQSLLAEGIEKVHRDTFHASLGLGRYALGLLWYRLLSGRSVEANSFQEFDEDVSSAQMAIVKDCVDRLTIK